MREIESRPAQFKIEVDGNNLDDDLWSKDSSRWEESTHRLRLDEHVRISLDVICCTIFNKTVIALGTRKITVDNFYFHCSPDKS